MVLLVAEHDANAGNNHLQHLVKYYFADGNYTEKQEILKVPSTKDGGKSDYIRFDIGDNSVFKNHYVVTGIGNIIDAANGKILSETKDRFVKFSGDSIVFYTNNVFKGKYYSVFNTKTEAYAEVKSVSFKAIPGQDVEVNTATLPFQIWMYDINGKRSTLVDDAGYGEYRLTSDKRLDPLVPMYWLDNNNMIYASFSVQKNMVAIYKVNTGKVIEKIGETESLSPSSTGSSFFRDPEGNIIFSAYGSSYYSVDVKKKKVQKLQWLSLGNGFTVEAQENPQYGRAIRYNGSDAGKYFCNVTGAKTTNGFLAIQYDIVIKGQRYTQGVVVWSAAAKKWFELDNTEVAGIVGWVEE